jgi:2-C-methyl-D-erythritol 4-phosphate cytidylyltransferase
MSLTSAIVLAAGKGRRLKARGPKPLIKINSLPLLIYSLRKLTLIASIKEIILVVNKLNRVMISRSVKQYRIRKVRHIVLGGVRRQDSVSNGLEKIDRRTKLVLIHDSARPFIDKKSISRLIKEARMQGAAILAVPLKATVKCAGPRYFVKNTLDRDNLWEIQTPQVFKKELIQRAYKRFGNIDVTDDAALAEKLGRKVKIVPGSYFNIKITTPEDLILAEAIAKTKKKVYG